MLCMCAGNHASSWKQWYTRTSNNRHRRKHLLTSHVPQPPLLLEQGQAQHTLAAMM